MLHPTDHLADAYGDWQSSYYKTHHMYSYMLIFANIFLRFIFSVILFTSKTNYATNNFTNYSR